MKPNSPHIALALNGAEILTNGSGSHHNLRKLDRRMQLITSAMAKSGGVYMYSNQLGCDGGRLYFDGCALICDNGDILAQGSQFAMIEVEVVTAVVDLTRTRSVRASFMSRCEQVTTVPSVPRILVSFRLCQVLFCLLFCSHTQTLNPVLPPLPATLLFTHTHIHTHTHTHVVYIYTHTYTHTHVVHTLSLHSLSLCLSLSHTHIRARPSHSPPTR